MTAEDILKLKDLGEQTRVQFKERITRENKNDISSEMVALSNTHGGIIVVGIDDKSGNINPLSYTEAQETNGLLSNLASESVIPNILIDIKNIPLNNGIVVVVSIKQGNNKPYRDNKGIIWVKQGADKRKVFDNTELIAMLMENGQIHPDNISVKNTSIDDLDKDILKEYIFKRFRNNFEVQEKNITILRQKSLSEIISIIGQTPENILRNLGLISSDKSLTLAALMLMGKYPQKWYPAFTVRCISYIGNNIGGTEFRDKSGGDADGNAVHLYKYIMSFLTRNLRHVQVEKDFNSQGELEVSTTTLSELVVNSILHRSYVIEAPLRVFIFDNRIEIHSPGLLPQGVNLESIKQGISVPRNKLLFNHGIHLLPYTGAGSGITRALRFTPNIKFVNDELLNEFIVTIYRSTNITDDKSFDRDDRDNAMINKGEDIKGTTFIDRDDRDKNDTTSYKNLDGIYKNIIQFCTIPRTAREILEHIGYSYHPTHIAKYIKPLINMGFLEMTEANKPNSKNQKYRRVYRN